MKYRGRILKLLGGFYYIEDERKEIFEARARGLFRHQNIKPLVGDYVFFTKGEGEHLSYIEEVISRKNALLRPPVANIDQVLLFVPVKQPKYNLFFIDKLIAYYETLNIEVLLTVSKSDLNIDKAKALYNLYTDAGFKTYILSIHEEKSIERLHSVLIDKTTALAGVSGSGKSTLTNVLLGTDIETQSVSKKNQRGRHTTRHTELLSGPQNMYLFDTPGFSSIELNNIESRALRFGFREFAEYAEECKFLDCTHINEPNCGVLQAVGEEKISKSRYKNYKRLFKDLVEKEKNAWR